MKNLYLITIYTPNYKINYSGAHRASQIPTNHIHSKFDLEGSSKSQILTQILPTIKQLKSTNKYTHFSIEEY